jgi:hypothetical protein
MSTTTTTNFDENPLLKIPIIQKVFRFGCKATKLSSPLRLATVCQAWHETCHNYGGATWFWIDVNTNGKKNQHSKLRDAFFHRLCSQPKITCNWIVQILLSEFININPLDSLEYHFGWNAFVIACTSGNVAALRLLFDYVERRNLVTEDPKQVETLVSAEDENQVIEATVSDISVPSVVKRRFYLYQNILRSHVFHNVTSRVPRRGVVAAVLGISTYFEIAAEYKNFDVMRFLIVEKGFDLRRCADDYFAYAKQFVPIKEPFVVRILRKGFSSESFFCALDCFFEQQQVLFKRELKDISLDAEFSDHANRKNFVQVVKEVDIASFGDETDDVKHKELYKILKRLIAPREAGGYGCETTISQLREITHLVD